MVGAVSLILKDCKIDLRYSSVGTALVSNADHDTPVSLSLVAELAFRKFVPHSIYQTKNLFIKKRFLYGRRCKTRTCDQAVMSGRL